LVSKVVLERRLNKRKLKEWSIAVRNRDENKCVICNSTEFLNAHHIFPKEAKRYRDLRFDINNGITLCSRHHKYSYDNSPHKNPLVFIVWLIKNRKEQLTKLYPEVYYDEILSNR